MRPNSFKYLFIPFINLLVCMHIPTTVCATEPGSGSDDALRRDILAMDARLSEAYAGCRKQRFRSLFARDAQLVFAGRGMARGISVHVDTLRREGCRQRREAAKSAQNIYAVPGLAGSTDGAIQVGTQTFCALDAQPCRGVETRFVALWRRVGGSWKITHLIRYDYAETDGA
ncbi:MAG: nuclear transport factor 2 family protein [Lysobacteraceae bacterium]|nr:MAG: nuclear transport factor 2 family protein [Xanthomonadaceae bacterium]